MAEAVWNGFLRLSLVSCPIYLSSATSTARRIKLGRLSARTGNPVAEQYVDVRTGNVVPADALGTSVGSIIDLEQFVPRQQIDNLHIDDTYYIHPDGQFAADWVPALRLAMQRSGRAALGHVRCDENERPALIEPCPGGLMMSTLRTADELVQPEFVERADDDIPGEMVEIAEVIIARRAADFDASILRGRFQDDLRALVEEKIKDAPPATAAPRRRPRLVPRPEVTAPPREPSLPAPGLTIAPAAPPVPEPPPRPPALEPAPELPAAAGGPHDIGTEILLHIMGVGDRRYVEPGWAGNPGGKRQIEALSIRPRDGLAPSAIEFRVFAQEGRATAWVSNGSYAGTRGRNLPLTGFAVRPVDELADRMEIAYHGSFFEGGVVGPKRNGELCVSPIADDPLEAVRVTIIDQGANQAAE